MKGECDGRELAPGAPVSVGAGGMSAHNREGATGRIEPVIKGVQDNAARNLQLPPVGGGTQGNGTPGFTVAQFTKMEDMTTATGNMQLPSAMGNIRVPSFRGQEGAPGCDGASVQGGDGHRQGGSIQIPNFNKEVWDLSCPTDIKKVSHSIPGPIHQPTSIKGGDERNATSTLTVTKGESRNTVTAEKVQISVPVTGSIIDTKRERQNKIVETLSTAITKRMNRDTGTMDTPLEACVKRLKKEAAPRTANVMNDLKLYGNSIAGLSNIIPVKRVSHDGVEKSLATPDIKRMRQDSNTETANLTAAITQNVNNVPETVNIANTNTMSQGTPLRTEYVQTLKTNDRYGASALVNVAQTKEMIEDAGTEKPQVESVKANRENGTAGETDPPVRGSPGGRPANSLVSHLMQDKNKSDTQYLNVSTVGLSGRIHPLESPSVPATKTVIPEVPDRDVEDSGLSDPKPESEGSPSGGSSRIVTKEDVNVGTGSLAASQQCSEENSEGKKENGMKIDKNVSKEGQGGDSERKGQACGSLPPRVVKPEMVSIETQCDDTGLLAVKDEYTFVSEDGGEPGECLGGCEPGKKPHKCFQCDTSFRTPYELSRHCRVHSGERPYQCRLCHRCFKRKDHVEIHMRRHVEDRRHACKECGVCFVTSSCLLRHQRRTHQALVPVPGTKRPGEGENGEGEGGEGKGDGKDLPASKDGQKNGKRNKKNKPDTTYRPGGKTVCIIKKRNLRQRSYSFVELEDDVECFESDEEDRIPFLKVEEQRHEEEQEEYGGSQATQLEHSLFPPSLFNPETSLEHLLLLGEVSRMLSHPMVPGSLEGAASQASMAAHLGRLVGPPQSPEEDSDDSDCDPPLVACDVTFMEGDEEMAGVSLPDDGSAAPHPEEVKREADVGKWPHGHSGPLHTPIKTEPCQTIVKGGPHHTPQGCRGVQGITTTSQLHKGGTTTTTHPGNKTPCTLGKPPPPTTTNKTGVGVMGEPRTAWVVPANNPKGKNTCDACRRRNEANRLAQAARERQAQATQPLIKQEVEEEEESKPADIALDYQIMADVKPPPTPPPVATPTLTPPSVVTPTPPPVVTPTPTPVVTPTPPLPPVLTSTPTPQKCQDSKPTIHKRGRKPGSTKKKRCGKASVGVEGGGGGGGSKRPYKCQLCPFSFRSATELKRHTSTHSGERPFLCELCGAGFMRKCHLQLHVRRHSGERRHACQECRMRFFTPSDLARHQAIHQAGDKPLECHLCHLTFRRAFHLERHIRRHNEAAPFACKLCGAFFSSAAALRSHDKHHRTPAPHACPDCTASFTTATALSRHRRVHSARHHRLLRAIERHATAKSSYECVSSEGSPLSLVIRKVASTATSAGEGGAKETLPDRSPKDKKEKEIERDKITSGFSTSDQELVEKVEGIEASTLHLSVNKETKMNEESVGNPVVTTFNNPTTTDTESEGKLEGGDDGTSTAPTSEDTKQGKENITTTPSVANQIKDNNQYTACPSPTGREKDQSETRGLTPSSIAKVIEVREKGLYDTSDRNFQAQNVETLSVAFMNEKQKREKILSAFSSLSSKSGIPGRVNSSSSSSSFGGKVGIGQDERNVFSYPTTLSHQGISREADTTEMMSFPASATIMTGTDTGYHKALPFFPSIYRSQEVRYEGMPNLPVTNRKTDHVEESGNINSCSLTNKDARVVPCEKLKTNSDLDLPTVAKQNKEAQGRNTFSLLLPTSREIEATKEEIHCRTTYQLTTPSVGQESLHSGPRFPSEQESNRGTTEEGRQKGSVRKGVIITS